MLVYIPKPLVLIEIMDKKEDFSTDGVKLLKVIANKNEDEEAATKAFRLFVEIFESKINKRVDIIARKNGYDANVAFEAIQCAFNKVWLYPTFNMSKAHCKNEEQAIIVWLVRIAVSQMYQFAMNGVCAQVKPEEDLSVIENAEDFVESFHASELSPEQKMQYVSYMEKKMSALDEKHRIVYLTYKAYHTSGKRLPRKLLENLRKRLAVTQTTIRVYKKEACETLNDLTLLQS